MLACAINVHVLRHVQVAVPSHPWMAIDDNVGSHDGDLALWAILYYCPIQILKILGPSILELLRPHL